MRSFAIWYNSRKTEDHSEIESSKIDFHINLWKKDLEEIFVFDFGIMVDDIKKIEDIYLYVPFEIKTEVKDLGCVLSKNYKLISAIFNENCRTSTFHINRLKISIEGKKEEFVLYPLKNSDIKREKIKNNNNHCGEKIILKLGNILSQDEISHNEDIDQTCKYYFRFRIEGDKKKISFIKNEDEKNSFFFNVFSRTESIDFRINDIRSCSDEIMEEYYRSDKFEIKKIHYLLLRSSIDDFIYYDGKVNSRNLEKELWNTYIEDSSKDLVAYHIKESKESKESKGITSFSKLVRFKYNKTSLIKIFFILIATFCLNESFKYFISLFTKKL